MALFVPTYFSPVVQYVKMVQSDVLAFETAENYQKQTYRNRCYICGANGKQALTVPVKHLQSNEKQKIKDTRIENSFAWQSQHLKSLQSAYGNSPYFEFYKDDICPIFTKKYDYLLDLNIDTFLFLNDALSLEKSFSKTTEYQTKLPAEDYRYLADAKSNIRLEAPRYFQLFEEKHGFIKNLSILDLLFVEGPNAISILYA